MFFIECAHLAKQHPDLARVFERLDAQLKAMGTVDAIRHEDLASFLQIDPNQTCSGLDLLAREGLLLRVEMIECPYCEMAVPRADYQNALDEDDEYRCTDCDRPIKYRNIRTITAYRCGERWPESLRPGVDLGQASLRDGSPAADKHQPEMERLIEGKQSLEVSAAARYLELHIDHVRRLVRTGKLTRVGRGRPVKVSTSSLREYKGSGSPADHLPSKA